MIVGQTNIILCTLEQILNKCIYRTCLEPESAIPSLENLDNHLDVTSKKANVKSPQGNTLLPGITMFLKKYNTRWPGRSLIGLTL